MNNKRLFEVLLKNGLITREQTTYIMDTPAEITVFTETKELTVKPKKSTKLNYDHWPYTPEEYLLNDWLKAKKKAKGSISQTAINTVGKELQIAHRNGFTVEQCLERAEEAGWRGFKAEWMGDDKTTAAKSVSSTIDRLTDRSWAN